MPMKKGQSSLTAVVIVAVIILLIAGGYYIWHRNRSNESGEYGNNNNSTSTTTWQTYTWGSFVFQYPADWSVREEKYATPAQTAAGEAPTTVGLTVYPENSSATSTNVISIGGRQTQCSTLSRTNLKCATFYDLPVYTKSTDLNVIGVYNQILPTITHDEATDDFKISAPKHLVVWEGGQTYSVDWVQTGDVSTTKVTVEIWNTSTSQLYKTATVADNGRYQFTVPNSKAASSTLHYVRVTASKKVSATSTKIWNGWSDPFYIEAAGPATSGNNSSSTLPQVVVTIPLPNSKITSPLTIVGKAMNPWYFEASFPIKLLSATGSVLAQTHGQAQTDWMQSGVYIPFTATLTFVKPTGSTTGTLVLENDNPSGDPSKHREFRIPVKF
jgi:hypothetical protein